MKGEIYISKKKTVNKKLIKGKFYLHNDKNGGHPSLIFDKNDNKNYYKAIQFSTSRGTNRARMRHNLNPNSNDDQFVMNRPIDGKRKDFSTKELNRLRVHKDDKPLINKIKRKNK